MQARPFNMKEDFPTLLSWLVQRRAGHIPTPKELPEVGFVIGDTAMVFLRKVEGGYGMIDGLTTNPMKDSVDRDEAINAALESVIMAADSLGMSALISLTLHDNLVDRVVNDFGFDKVGHKAITFNFGTATK